MDLGLINLQSFIYQKIQKTNRSFIIFTNPSAQAGYDTRSIFKMSLTGLNSEFSFSYTSCLTKAEEPSLPYHLPIAGGRIIGLIPFPKVLVLCEMQSVSSRIWTRVAVFIFYDDNHYTTGTSNRSFIFIFLSIFFFFNTHTHTHIYIYIYIRRRRRKTFNPNKLKTA